MANAVQDKVDCQACLDLEQDSKVYLVLDHYDDVKETLTLLYQCTEGHSWSEVEEA